MTPFQVYKQYLVQVAVKEGRPFAIPKSTETFEARTDKSFFYALCKMLKKDDVDRSKLALFMETACNNMTYFHISNVVTDYEDLYKKFKMVKPKTKKDEYIAIKIAFDRIKEYAIINKLQMEDLEKGSPPILLKLWKKWERENTQGRIGDEVIVTLLDFNKLKKKSWYRIYCGGIIPRLKQIQDKLKNDVDLNSFIECELLKINSELKNIKE